MSFFSGDGGNARARFEGAAEGDGGEDDRTSLPPLEGKEKNLYHIYKNTTTLCFWYFHGLCLPVFDDAFEIASTVLVFR